MGKKRGDSGRHNAATARHGCVRVVSYGTTSSLPPQQHVHIVDYAKTNARREQMKRLTVLRAIVNALSERGLQVGLYKVKLVPRSKTRVKGPHEDLLRFKVIEGGLCAYSLKSMGSSAVKSMKKRSGATLAEGQVVATGFNFASELKEAEAKINALRCAPNAEENKMQLEWMQEIIGAFNKKREIRRSVLAFAAQTHSPRYSHQLFQAIVKQIDELISQRRRMDFSREESYKFRENAKKFVENSWPVTVEDAKAFRELYTPKAQRELANALATHLQAEESAERGALEYQMHESVLDAVHGLEAALRMLEQQKDNVHQEAIEQGALRLWEKFSTLCNFVVTMEKNVRELKNRRAGSFDETFATLCQAAVFRSRILNVIFETYNELKKSFNGKPIAYITEPLEKVFFELVRTDAEKENKFWQSLVLEMGECARNAGKAKKEHVKKWKAARARIEAYMRHLKDLEKLEGERKRALQVIEDAEDGYKGAKSAAERRLREKIAELADIAPVEAEAISSAYDGMKAHVRYRLGDWMHDASHCLTGEKLIETMRRKAYAQKEGVHAGAKLVVYGKPLLEYESQFKAWTAELIELNEKIFKASARLEIARDTIVRQAERIGYLEANADDMNLNRAGTDRLLKSGSSGKTLTFTYDEHVEEEGVTITLESSELKKLEVKIPKSMFGQDDFMGERRDVERAIGERFKTNDAVEHAYLHYEGDREMDEKYEEYERGRMSAGYGIVATYLAQTLERHFEEERKAQNPQDVMHQASYWEREPIAGAILKTSEMTLENPPKLTCSAGENTLRLHAEQTQGERFNKIMETLREFRERHTMHAMADEMHVLMPLAVVRELNELAEKMAESTR